MSDTARLRFLPWARAGAAQALAGDDPLVGALPANAALQPWVRIAGYDAIGQTMALRGPGHVTALGAQTIIKMEPADGTQDFEPNYFPFVELRGADLPWRYTPAASGTNNQLRPWLVLVVVRRQDGVSVATEPGAKLPVLRIEAPAKPSLELPDLRDSAAWVHVQTALEPGDLAAALNDDPAAAVARLLCPRRLEPNSAWIACLVPAFDVGRLAGLGEADPTAGEALPAWDIADETLDQETLRLPIYHRWSFSTGPEGDFESLARRLKADEGETTLGRVELDVTNPGPPLPQSPATKPVLADFVGALRSPGVQRKDVPRQYREWIEEELEKLIERGARRPRVAPEAASVYVPERDDPVVTPPLYGSFQADRYDVPDQADATRGWMRALNLRPELRAIAGLGAAVVRASQESLMASAWSQAGAMREAQRVFDQGRLAAEIGRSLARRAAPWEPGAVLQATQRIHAWVSSPGSQQPLAVDLMRSAVPPGLVGAPFARAARAGSALARAWTRRLASRQVHRPALASTTETFMAATSPTAGVHTRTVLDFAKTTLPAGAWTHDAALEAEAMTALSRATAPPGKTARAAPARPGSTPIGHTDLIGPISGKPFDRTCAGAVRLESELLQALSAHHGTPAPSRPVLDLSTAAACVIAQIDPLRSIQSGLLARIPALSGLVAADGALPSRFVLHPIFTDALSWDLTRVDARYLVPGADRLRNNRVTLLQADDDFVAALLAGANHGMSRELIWREFPTSPRHTFFHRFWDTGEGGPDDSGEISRWEKAKLGANLTGVTSDALTVVVLRGDIVRRYRGAHIYLTAGRWQDDAVVPDATRVSEPLLQGALDRSTVFYGYAISSSAMRGSRDGSSRTPASAGWFITIEEPSHGPRFGIDAAADDGSDLITGALGWNALTWGHLVPSGGMLANVRFAVARLPLPSRTSAELGPPKWGHNSAHMAAIAWQHPFRLYIHADRLLPERTR